jgi:hypothetical protein
MSLKNADCGQNLPTIPLPHVQENKTKSNMLHKKWVPTLAKKIHPRLHQKIQKLSFAILYIPTKQSFLQKNSITEEFLPPENRR